jgi:hypothetical protein
MKRAGIFALVFALVFGLLASWIGPLAIAYWYRPPVPAGANAAFNCTEAVEWGMGRLLWTQVIGIIGGALVGLIIGLMWARHKTALAAAGQPPKSA